MRRHETASSDKWDDATYKNGESGVHCQRTDNAISKWIGNQLQERREEGWGVQNLDRRRLWIVARRLLSNILDNSKQIWTFLNLEKDKEKFVFGTLVTCTLVSRWAYSFTLNTEAICSSEISVDIQRTTRNYIAEDRTHKEFVLFFLLPHFGKIKLGLRHHRSVCVSVYSPCQLLNACTNLYKIWYV
jgi:hypothetical protein